MSNVMSSSKSRSATSASVTNTQSNPNLSEIDSKVQSSYLVSGIISEIRPSGNVIVETSRGVTRALMESDDAREGDNVKVRISLDKNGEEKTIIVENLSSKDRSSAKGEVNKSLLQYVSEIFNPKSKKSPSYPASFSYLAPNMNRLKYGHIKVGQSVNVQIANNNIDYRQEQVKLMGTVISNENGILLVNSDIGILNIYTKSPIGAGQKMIIIILDSQDPTKAEALKNTITSFMNYIGDNINILKQIVFYNKKIHEASSYTKLLKFATTPHDNAILAKIFHQTNEVPASEVSNWINKEIVEPFESSSKNHKIKILYDQILKIEDLLDQMGLVASGEVKEFWMNIPNSNQKAKILVKREEDNINFKVDIDHPKLGQMMLEGNIFMELQHIKHMSVILHHGKDFPESFSNGLVDLYSSHLSSSNIDGDISFNKT